MPKSNPIQDINLRKQMLRMEIRQQEMEIQQSVRELGAQFTFPALRNSVFSYVLSNPETAFKVGLTAVNIITRLFQGTKKRSKKRSTGKK